MVVQLRLLPPENSDYRERRHFSSEKQLIGKEVANCPNEFASLFIDIGSTPEAVATELLEHQNLRIVTNNLNAAYILMQNNTFDITMAGGSLRQDGGIIGEATICIYWSVSLRFRYFRNK